MQGPSWVALLRRIPATLQDSIMVVTRTATEIVLQSIVRLEKDFAVVRGRMAGSTETGRVLFIPYDQIEHIGITKKITEPELQAMLGKPGMTVQFVENGEAVEAPFEEAPFLSPAPVEEPTPAPEQPAAKAPAQAAHPSKSVLLARLRARLTADPAKQADL